MLTKRIIPCLDVRSGRVVKGVNFEGLRDVDDPVALARFYNDSGADELFEHGGGKCVGPGGASGARDAQAFAHIPQQGEAEGPVGFR